MEKGERQWNGHTRRSVQLLGEWNVHRSIWQIRTLWCGCERAVGPSSVPISMITPPSPMIYGINRMLKMGHQDLSRSRSSMTNRIRPNHSNQNIRLRLLLLLLWLIPISALPHRVSYNGIHCTMHGILPTFSCRNENTTSHQSPDTSDWSKIIDCNSQASGAAALPHISRSRSIVIVHIIKNKNTLHIIKDSCVSTRYRALSFNKSEWQLADTHTTCL